MSLHIRIEHYEHICQTTRMALKQAAFGHPEAVYTDIVVPPECEGLRADVFLTRHVDYASRARITEAIKRGDLSLVDRALKPSTRLQPTDIIRFWRLPPDRPSDLQPAPTVIYADEYVVAINKPAHLATHPARHYYYRTVTHWAKMKAEQSGYRAHPCHRLDRETTGIMILAHNKDRERAIKKAFMDNRVQKTYLAIVVGHLQHAQTITHPLRLQGEDGLVNIKMITDHQNGLPALTKVEPLHYDQQSEQTLVVCHPKTGRQHQIRAHLSQIGFPILGDKLYCHGEDFFDRFSRGVVSTMELNRLESPHHMLHAACLSLPSELCDQPILKAPLPESWPYWALAHQDLF